MQGIKRCVESVAHWGEMLWDAKSLQFLTKNKLKVLERKRVAMVDCPSIFLC